MWLDRSRTTLPSVRVYHCDGYAMPLPEGHRFPQTKYRLLRERLLSEGVLSPGELVEAEPIEPWALRLAHTDAYVDAILDGALTPADERKLGFPWSEGLVQRSRASVGGTVSAARAALDGGAGQLIAGNLAGGTHHAFAGRGEGYCVFNDHAVTVRLLQREGLIERALIVDLDVHQGNGTAAIFAGDDSVLTFSMHGAKNFPFRKERSSLDVDLPDGCGDAGYLGLLEQHLPRLLEQSKADLLLYQAGVDPLAEDGLGRLDLSLDGLRARDRFVLRLARAHALPIVLTLGGGYAKPISLSVEAHLGTYREARAVFGPAAR